MHELPVLEPGTQLHTCAVDCGARCCNYIATPIDTPKSKSDFDDVRWYLMHEDIHVYKLDGVWHLLVNRRCRHLLPNNVCGNYDNRPKVCDDYDAKSCEYTGEVDYQHYFNDDAELETWLATRKAKKKAKKTAKAIRKAGKK